MKTHYSMIFSILLLFLNACSTYDCQCPEATTKLFGKSNHSYELYNVASMKAYEDNGISYYCLPIDAFERSKSDSTKVYLLHPFFKHGKLIGLKNESVKIKDKAESFVIVSGIKNDDQLIANPSEFINRFGTKYTKKIKTLFNTGQELYKEENM